MPKNKRPAPRKSSIPPEEKEDFLSAALCALALELAEQEDGDTAAHSEALRQKDVEFQRQLRKYLNQHKDEVLYGAIDLASFEDVGAYQLLRSSIEEAAATVVLWRENAPSMEINAFAIPVFVHSQGGLAAADGFQDEAAFDALVASFGQAQLESADARVVLMQHAYDLREVERISYSQLHAMVREAATSMTEKKMSAAPALERSMAGWSETAFGADDDAVELRFLLGFALKRADDPFYAVPADEAQADAYFEQRMERYRAWTQQAGPLVRRCLATGPRADTLTVNFLYQDLFFGALEQGIAEHAMLRMISELRAAASAHGGPVRAVIAPADVDGAMLLRVQLYGAADGALLATSDKPLELGADLELEVDDVADALASIAIADVAVAQRFDAAGQPVDSRRLG